MKDRKGRRHAPRNPERKPLNLTRLREQGFTWVVCDTCKGTGIDCAACDRKGIIVKRVTARLAVVAPRVDNKDPAAVLPLRAKGTG